MRTIGDLSDKEYAIITNYFSRIALLFYCCMHVASIVAI